MIGFAVEEATDEALDAGADRTGAVAAMRRRSSGLGIATPPAQVGAGAEVPLTHRGDHDRALGSVRVGVVEVLDHPVAHPQDRSALRRAGSASARHVVRSSPTLSTSGTSVMTSPPVHRGHRTAAGLRGLMSSSATSPARSCASRPTFTMTSTSASRSAACRERHGASGSRRARGVCGALRRPNGGREGHALSTSTNTPREADHHDRLNSSSCDTPTTISTPPITCSHTRMPRSPLRPPPLDLVARARRSRRRTSRTCPTTRPHARDRGRSCATARAPTASSPPGNRLRRARPRPRFAARRARRMPYAFSTCFDAFDSVDPRSVGQHLLRAAAGEASAGAEERRPHAGRRPSSPCTP